MDNYAEKSVQNLLLPNENILWNGSPNLSKIFMKRDLFWIPVFAIIGLKGILFWYLDSVSSISADRNLMMPFIVFPIIVCISFIIDRLMIRKSIRRRTTYIITNMRVIVVVKDSNGINDNVSSLEFKKIFDESVSWDKNGVGTIYFGETHVGNQMYWIKNFKFSTGSLQYGIISFFDIEDCEHVFNIYKNAKKLK